jgi:hypothetical protein
MGSAVIRTRNGHHTHKVVVDEAMLDRVAEALGIPPDQRRQLIPGAESIHIYRGTFQPSGSQQTSGAAQSPGATPSPSGGARP